MTGKAKLLFLCLLFLSQVVAAADDYRITHVVSGKFEDVRDSVVDAIAMQGLVINNVSHMSEMLDRTGQDLGDTTQIFRRAEILEFCSAAVSRASMKADPHSIVFCPYGIAVYELPAEPGKIYVSYRKPVATGKQQDKKSVRTLEKLMHDIVQDAIQK
ncbi:MAG TPA: DUF302 domain-containing protein [Sulfuricella sp.]|nr:DUF302 domain-containing protein [Sulfuricella sp.]